MYVLTAGCLIAKNDQQDLHMKGTNNHLSRIAEIPEKLAKYIPNLPEVAGS
ncbi:hypothetical protein VHA_001456 [Grimontia hollisae CIP 101886]|uniref:Uncharacterized protein n=1 Tax=Grimontia hollisae CIP 101886 TaxID=675812 RepID=D0I6T7_GRIHO|nr:hypothetical protein VHA_001456 [Grimontia hollisae CIP 101886]